MLVLLKFVHCKYVGEKWRRYNNVWHGYCIRRPELAMVLVSGFLVMHPFFVMHLRNIVMCQRITKNRYITKNGWVHYEKTGA